jgi:hypothetical protein
MFERFEFGGVEESVGWIRYRLRVGREVLLGGEVPMPLSPVGFTADLSA